jgi:prephenate dehydrogenase
MSPTGAGPMKKKKIAIIGVGLLGGSLALALRRQKGLVVMGWNHRPSSRKRAARLLPVASTFEEAVRGASVVLLCTHSGSISKTLTELKPRLGKDALVMDVSSVKGPLAMEAQRMKGASGFFVPCHPMAGKEKSGPEFADRNLYFGRYVFITPLSRNPRSLVGRAVRFWRGVGAHPVVVDPFLHDRAVALTSHLPHLLASAFMEVYSRYQGGPSIYHQGVGSGFRDFTRIAAGNPAMWSDIVDLNSDEILKFLVRYRRKLSELEKNLKRGRARYWASFFERARAARDKVL